MATVSLRPERANGVIFLTLEDEFVNINVIVWPNLVEQLRRELMTAQLICVYGVWQSKQGVRNLIAKRLVDCTQCLESLKPGQETFTDLDFSGVRRIDGELRQWNLNHLTARVRSNLSLYF